MACRRRSGAAHRQRTDARCVFAAAAARISTAACSPARCSICRAYRGIVAYEPTELVITARAARRSPRSKRRWRERARCWPSSRRISAMAPRVGGCVAAGLSGPRRPTPARCAISCSACDCSTARARCCDFGGQVMKNVAGYDVSRLLAGSLGTLGLIAEVSLKVLPQPAAEPTLRVRDAGGRSDRAGSTSGAASRCRFRRDLLCRQRLAVRLSGARAAVERGSATSWAAKRLPDDAERSGLPCASRRHRFSRERSQCAAVAAVVAVDGTAARPGRRATRRMGRRAALAARPNRADARMRERGGAGRRPRHAVSRRARQAATAHFTACRQPLLALHRRLKTTLRSAAASSIPAACTPSSESPMQTRLADFIRDTPDGHEADAILRKCVHCGFCTATCPTYQLLGDELDGPRGRIYLIKQVLEGAPVTDKTQLHLDRCLTCRSCETTCPSGVSTAACSTSAARVVDAQRAAPGRGSGCTRWCCARLLPRQSLFAPAAARSASGCGRCCRRRCAAKFRTRAARARRVAGCGRHPRGACCCWRLRAAGAGAEDQCGDRARARPPRHRAVEQRRGAGCCGALRFHLNDQERALDDMRRNIDAWWPHVERRRARRSSSPPRGCGVMVKDYGHLLARRSRVMPTRRRAIARWPRRRRSARPRKHALQDSLPRVARHGRQGRLPFALHPAARA